MKTLLMVVLLVFISGCEHIPSKTYKLKTEGGEIIKLQCPLIDDGRSKFTFIIDSKCILVK